MEYKVLLHKKHIKPLSGGFGLIELIVSIGIMVLVLTVILVRQDSFNSAVLLRSQVYEIALRLREIQLYAVSVTGGTTGNYRQQYGVHFDTTASNNQVYRPFSDLNNDGFWDVGAGESFDAPGVIDPRFEIRAIRAGETPEPSQLSIVFVRPNFDAKFYTGTTELATSSVQIDIALKNAPGGATGPEFVRTLEVTRTGQISVP